MAIGYTTPENAMSNKLVARELFREKRKNQRNVIDINEVEIAPSESQDR